MIIEINKNRAIADLQYDFSRLYPFLKLDFYKNTSGKLGSIVKHKLNKTMLLNIAGNQKEGGLEISDSMIVANLEKTFQNRFGLAVQVSRKSGAIWLETTMTDNWTLKQQNEHGRELSTPANIVMPDIELDYD